MSILLLEDFDDTLNGIVDFVVSGSPKDLAIESIMLDKYRKLKRLKYSHMSNFSINNEFTNGIGSNQTDLLTCLRNQMENCHAAKRI